MTEIEPSRSAVSPPLTLLAQISPRRPLWSRLEARWNEIQVGRQGSYSVERLESFDTYCKTTSWSRVVSVCIFTPFPALTADVLLESLPLRPPSEGWKANWLFWVRIALMELVVSFSGVAQLSAFVPGISFTSLKRLAVSCGTSAGYVGTCLIAANTIGFPVPLMIQIGSVPVAIIIQLMLHLVLGRKVFAKDSQFQVYLKPFDTFLSAYMSLFGIYPLYKVLYDFVPRSYRAIVVIILPFWRLAAKQIMVRATRGVEDFMPQALFIATDVAQSILEFREVRENATTLLQLIQDRQASQIDLSYVSYPGSHIPKFMEFLQAVVHDPGNFHASSLESVRLRACVPHLLTEAQTKQLNVLEASGVYRRNAMSKRRQERPKQPKFRSRVIAVAAINQANHTKKLHFPQPEGPNINPGHAEHSKKLVQQGLQLLFHCEYRVLVEYIECIVPLVFVIFKSIVAQLPNIVYYPGGAGSWTASTVSNVLVFASLEIGSLLLLNIFLRRKFGFSPLYQLAFVLETQIYQIQSSLVIEIIILLQYELLHLGADFTLRFEWLERKG